MEWKLISWWEFVKCSTSQFWPLLFSCPEVPFFVLETSSRLHVDEALLDIVNTSYGDVTRDNSERRSLVQHSLAMLEQCCHHFKQCRSNVSTLHFAKNRRCESQRVTSPLCFDLHSRYSISGILVSLLGATRIRDSGISSVKEIVSDRTRSSIIDRKDQRAGGKDNELVWILTILSPLDSLVQGKAFPFLEMTSLKVFTIIEIQSIGIDGDR